MAYVNDAQTLADVVSPAAAAAQMGIQNDAANQQQQIANTTAQGQQAAEIAKPGLQNMFTQAQTANEQAVGQQNQTAADIGSATAPGKIGATNAASQTSITADNVKQVGQLGQIAGQVAGIMDQVPAPARPAAMQQIAQQYGIDPSRLGPLMSGDPAALRQVASSAIQSTADYQQKQMEESMHNEGSANVASISSEGRVSAASQAANARVQAAQIQQKTHEMAQTFEQAAVAAERAGDHAAAQKFYQAAQNTRQMAAQTTAGLVGYVPSSPDFNSGGGASQPAPQAPANAGAPDSNAIEAEMKRRGLLK